MNGNQNGIGMGKIIGTIVGIAVFIALVALTYSDAGYGGNTQPDYKKCIVCGKQTTMEISGTPYCMEHYNKRLFD